MGRGTEVLHNLSTRVLQWTEPFHKAGQPVYEKEWDCLVVVDGCRADTFEVVTADYGFLPAGGDSMRSVASSSETWMKRTFESATRDQLASTVYVTANPFSRNLDGDRFQKLDEVWTNGWNEEHGTVLAETLTDRAIANYSAENPDQLIVHYMQPHFPSVPDPLGSGIALEEFGSGWESIWSKLEDGVISQDRVRQSYRRNLRYVLDNVATLQRNIDADKLIVSSDHGNAFGEWGQYGHPSGVAIESLRKVPWAVTSATGSDSYEPDIDDSGDESTKRDVESRLRDLGYKGT
jgi:hypothetical protein